MPVSTMSDWTMEDRELADIMIGMDKTYMDRDTAALYIFTTALLLLVWIVTGPPLLEAGDFGKLAALTGLIGLHAAVHWLGPRIVAEGRPWLYTGLQVVLANTIAFFFLSDIGLISTLFAPLFGAAVGIFGTGQRAMKVMLVYLLSAFAMYFAKDPANFLIFISSTIVVWSFVAIVVLIYARQREERERSEKLADELQAANERLQESAARIRELTMTSERQRLARELHDTLAQGLSAIVLQLEATKTHLENGHVSRAQEIVDRAMLRARETLADSRAAIDDLRATNEGPVTIEAAIRRQIEKFRQTTGLPCELGFEVDSPPPFAPGTLEEIEKIVSEGLANIAKHAGASEASVVLTDTDGTLQIEVRDNGVGFEPTEIPAEGQYGIIGMKERARLIGGSIVIERAPEKGMSLRLNLDQRTTPAISGATDV